MHWWSVARIDLRLTDDEFYALTPRQFYALIKRHETAIEHSQLLAGIIASTIANHSLNPPSKPATPEDYMPSHHTVAEEKKPRMNRKRIASNVTAFLTAQAALLNRIHNG